jgi:trehalose 6-phosphate phosphatase
MTRAVQARQLADTLRDRLGSRRLVLLIDFDGLLIEPSAFDEGVRATLERVAGVHPLYVISGREASDLRARIRVEGVEYVGALGFDLMDALPDIDRQALDEAVIELETAANEIEHWLDYIEGVVIERRKFSFALHYRMVDKEDLQQINAASGDVLERYASLNWRKGKKVIEFVPDMPWDKGLCVRAVIARHEETSGSGALFPVFLGDDPGDEDVFRVLDPARELGVLVALGERASAAEFRLHDQEAVAAFLAELA